MNSIDNIIESKLLLRTRNGDKYWRPDDNVNEEKVIISKLVEDYYEVGSIFNIIKMKSGVSSSCYHLLTNKGEFILKSIEKNFMNYPYNEFNVHGILESENIPVSKFYPTINGEFVLNHEDNTYHLQSFIKGEIYRPNTSPQWLLDESPIMLGRIQKAMDKIPKLPNGIGEEFFKNLTPQTARLSYLETLKLSEARNDINVINDINYRISILDVIKKVSFEVSKLTCKNTHGDYFISQLICGRNSISAVIDFTSACVHPICWEVIRSYSFADVKCAEGNIDIKNLKKYVDNFLKYGELSDYDLKIMPYLYFYQLVVSNYFNQYYLSNNLNKLLLLEYAHFSTNLCRWFEFNVDKLSNELSKGF